MNYHISWLESAIKGLKESNSQINSINGDMTIGEFLYLCSSEELNNAIEVEEEPEIQTYIDNNKVAKLSEKDISDMIKNLI